MCPTHWLIPHHADTVSAGREEAGDHMKGGGGGERKEVEDGCAGRQNHGDGAKQLHRGKTTESLQEA